MANTLKFGNGEWYGKKNTILAYNDENNNYKPLPFNFSRASKATVVNKDGLIETVGGGQPRVDYKDDSKGALLLEPQRTNLVTYSEDFESYFNVTEITLNSNYAISPDGTLNANKITFPSSSNSMYKSGLSLSGIHTISFYVKGEGANIGKTFDVDISGTSVSQNIDVTLTNKWVRFEAQTDGLTLLQITNRNNTTIGTGSLLLYGFQIELGSYATSIIKTQGSAVTRVADSCSQTVPDGVIGQTEGTMYAEYYFDATIDNSGGSDRDIVSISANSSNFIKIIHYGNGSSSANKKVYLYATVGGSPVVNIQSSVQSSGLMKVAAAYKNNDYVLYVNGVQIGTDSNAGVPACSVFTLGKFTSAIPTPTPINETKLYNTRLSNSELAALTQV